MAVVAAVVLVAEGESTLRASPLGSFGIRQDYVVAAQLSEVVVAVGKDIVAGAVEVGASAVGNGLGNAVEKTYDALGVAAAAAAVDGGVEAFGDVDVAGFESSALLGATAVGWGLARWQIREYFPLSHYG